MIVLDASVLIAHLAGDDTHTPAALEILDTEEDLSIHPMTLAEALVGPVRVGRDAESLHTIDRLGIVRLIPPFAEPLDLARLRADTGLRLPDCCVLATAMRERATLATFDARLATAAADLGVNVVGAAGAAGSHEPLP